jgi:hypothetical protein
VTKPLVSATADDPHEIILMVVPALPSEVRSEYFALDSDSDSTLIYPGQQQAIQTHDREDVEAELARLIQAHPGHIFTLTLRNTLTGDLTTRSMDK